MILETLEKEKESWKTKLALAETKAKEISSIVESSNLSLKEAHLSKKEYESEVSKLKDELVETYDTYFELAKENVFFFYYESDLRCSISG